MKYKLPCTCGQTIPVEVAQAGQTVQCRCGARVEVPAMRLIRGLPAADPVGPVKAPAGSSWSLLPSLLFAIGMLLIVGGLGVAGYYQLGRANLSTDESKWDNLEESHARIDAFKIDEAWHGWTILRNDKIGPYTPPVFVVHRIFSEYWLKHVLSSLAVAAVGCLLVVVAFLTRSTTRRTRRPVRRGPATPANRHSSR